jgi:hypothetical protein
MITPVFNMSVDNELATCSVSSNGGCEMIVRVARTDGSKEKVDNEEEEK